MARGVARDIREALGRIPGGIFIMTAAFEEARTGAIVRWVQACSDDPPMVMLSLRKGHPISPLVRDSRHFGLCQVASDDRTTVRRFSTMKATSSGDTFLGFPVVTAATGAPILERTLAYLDCEVHRHIDIDADHEIFVGLVHAGKLRSTREDPAVLLNGEKLSKLGG